MKSEPGTTVRLSSVMSQMRVACADASARTSRPEMSWPRFMVERLGEA
jgi:hypothetical protein